MLLFPANNRWIIERLYDLNRLANVLLLAMLGMSEKETKMSIFGKLFGKAPTREEFVKIAARAMNDCGWPDVVYDKESNSLRLPGGQLYGLHNLYGNYVATKPRDRAQMLRNWFAALRSQYVPESFDEARGNLMLMLRHRSERLQALMHTKIPDEDFLSRPFSEDLELAIVLDRPEAVLRITRKHLATWGAADELVYEVATHNLRLKSADAWAAVAPGVFLSQWHDVFDATRVIFSDLIHRVPAEGNRVVMIPDRSNVLVAGERDPAAVVKMIELALSLYDQDKYQLSAQPLILRDGEWVPYPVPDSLAYQVRSRTLGALAERYNIQKQLLEKSPREDIFVASLLVAGSQEKRDVFSIGTWATGVRTLLPKADVIMFGDAVENMFRVRWDDVVRVIGALPQEPDLWPVRYRAETYPTEEQIAALRQYAVG